MKIPLNALLFTLNRGKLKCVVCMSAPFQCQWLEFKTKQVNQKHNTFFRFEKTAIPMNSIFQKSIGILVSLQNTVVSQNFSNLGMSYLMFLLGSDLLPFQ